MSPLRVLVADDDTEIRKVLTALIGADPRLELVGVARDAEEAIRLAEERTPDVALLDVKMPKGGGMEAARGIGRASAGTRMVALSAYADEGSMEQMREAGVERYVLKGQPARAILRAIHGGDEP